MKNRILFYIPLLLISSLLLSNSSLAQAYTQWHLPEGAKMRLGKGEIKDIKFSPDGSLLAVGTSIGIWIYDVQSLKEVAFLKSEINQINTITFIDNGAALVSASDGGMILTWKINTHNPPINPSSPKMLRRLAGTGHFWGSALSNDGNRLAIGDGSGSISLWDLRTGNKISTFKAHSDSVNGLAFSPDGNTLVSGSWDSQIHLWDVATQKRRQTLTESFHTHTVAFSPDGKTVASGSFSGTAQSWDLETKEKLVTFNGHIDAIQTVAFSPDGKMLASGSWDATIRLWDTNTGDQIGIITGHKHFVEEMAFAPDGNSVAGTARGMISLWDTNKRSEHPLQIRKSSGLFKVLAFSKDSSTLLSADVGFKLHFTGVSTNRELFSRTFDRHKGGYWAAAFSSDLTIIANANTDKKIRLWDVTTGDELLMIRSGFKEAIITLDFSSDGKMLAGAGEEGSIRLWDTTTGDSLAILKGHAERIECLAFSPDGKMLASGSWDGTMRLWDIEAKTQISQRGRFMGGIIAVQFSLDGKTVVCSTQSKAIQLWKVDDERQIPSAMLTGHNGWIRNLAFSEDGKTLASGSDDGTILLWDWAKIDPVQ